MKEYISVDTKQMRKSTRIAAVAAGLFFMGLGHHQTLHFIAGLMGESSLPAMLLSKETVVCEEGIVVRYNAILYQYREVSGRGRKSRRFTKNFHRTANSTDCAAEGYHDQKTCLFRFRRKVERGSGVRERNES